MNRGNMMCEKKSRNDMRWTCARNDNDMCERMGSGDDTQREEDQLQREEDQFGGRSLFTFLFAYDINLITKKEEKKEEKTIYDQRNKIFQRAHTTIGVLKIQGLLLYIIL